MRLGSQVRIPHVVSTGTPERVVVVVLDSVVVVVVDIEGRVVVELEPVVVVVVVARIVVVLVEDRVVVVTGTVVVVVVVPPSQPVRSIPTSRPSSGPRFPTPSALASQTDAWVVPAGVTQGSTASACVPVVTILDVVSTPDGKIVCRTSTCPDSSSTSADRLVPRRTTVPGAESQREVGFAESTRPNVTRTRARPVTGS